jgi:hypothetical protein
MVEAHELARQSNLAPLRHLAAAIVQVNGGKITPQQLMPLHMIDGKEEDKFESALNRALAIAKQIKDGRVKNNTNGGD